MEVGQQIQEIVHRHFDCHQLMIENESDQHSGPPGRSSHFKLAIISDDFEGMSLIARHRAVNKVLHEVLATIHALALHTHTVSEYRAKNETITASPACKGGSK